MSMNDKSYCNTVCNQEDCERNLRFNKPKTKYYSVTDFGDSITDLKYCIWKIKKEKQKNE